MQVIKLNHAQVQQHSLWMARVLLIVGALATVGLGAAIHKLNALTSVLEADASHLRHPQSAGVQPRMEAALQREEIAAAQVAMAELALPWEPLFKILEQTRSPRVKLLGMEPDPKRGKLRITAEANEAQDMLDYVLTLGRQPMLQDVFLLHHERGEGDAAGIRFAVEAVWDMKS